MKETISEILLTLHRAGERPYAGFPKMFSNEMNIVSTFVVIDAVRISQKVLGGYLGTSEGVAKFGMYMEMDVGLHVYAPYLYGGTPCGYSVQNAALAMRAGVSGYRVSKINTGAVWFDAKSDCYRGDVTLTLTTFLPKEAVAV